MVNQFVLASSPLRPTTRYFLFQLNPFSHSPYVTSSLTRRWVCLLNYSCQSQSYVTTDGQSVSLCWNKAPIWGLRPDLYYCLTVAGLLVWGALSDERTGLSFAIATGPRRRSNFRVRVLRTRGHILLSQIRDLPFCRLLRLAGFHIF
jgi:hypothetical protein